MISEDDRYFWFGFLLPCCVLVVVAVVLALMCANKLNNIFGQANEEVGDNLSLASKGSVPRLNDDNNLSDDEENEKEDYSNSVRSDSLFDDVETSTDSVHHGHDEHSFGSSHTVGIIRHSSASIVHDEVDKARCSNSNMIKNNGSILQRFQIQLTIMDAASGKWKALRKYIRVTWRYNKLTILFVIVFYCLLFIVFFVHVA